MGRGGNTVWCGAVEIAVEILNGRVRFILFSDLIDKMKIDLLDVKFWKNVVDKSLAAIYITDENGKVLYVNDVVERATGYSKEEIYSLDSIFELAHPEDRVELLELFSYLKLEVRDFMSRDTSQKVVRLGGSWVSLFLLIFLGKNSTLGLD